MVWPDQLWRGTTYGVTVPLYIFGKHLFSLEGTTPRDPLAMAMYAICVIPLIDAIHDYDVQLAWFTDGATAAGSISGLHKW